MLIFSLLIKGLNYKNIEDYDVTQNNNMNQIDNYNSESGLIGVDNNFSNTNTTNSDDLNKKKKLIVICNGNSANYELMYCNSYWIKFYLECLNNNGEIEILLWNYRGYSNNPGNINFNIIKHDTDKLISFIESKNKYEEVMFHGYSLGGYSASYATSIYKKVSTLLLDRTFWSIEEIIKTFPLGNALYYLYRFVTYFDFGSSNNLDNYNNIIKSRETELESVTRIIAYDPNDAVIPELASFKTGLTFTEYQGSIIIERLKSSKSILLDQAILKQEESDKNINLINCFKNSSLYNNYHDSVLNLILKYHFIKKELHKEKILKEKERVNAEKKFNIKQKYIRAKNNAINNIDSNNNTNTDTNTKEIISKDDDIHRNISKTESILDETLTVDLPYINEKINNKLLENSQNKKRSDESFSISDDTAREKNIISHTESNKPTKSISISEINMNIVSNANLESNLNQSDINISQNFSRINQKEIDENQIVEISELELIEKVRLYYSCIIIIYLYILK